MAYQFCDPFDHYNTADLIAQDMWELVSGSPVIGAYGRFPAVGSYPNQGVSIPGSATLRKNMKSNQATLITFMSYGCVALPGSGSNPILGWLDNGTTQCYLGITSSGALQFYTYSPGFSPVAIGPSSALGLIAPAPTAAPNHGIEMQVTFSATVGTVECYLDGALVIALTTGLNTIKSSNSYANQVNLGELPSYSTVAMYCDYIRVWDNTGSYQNAPLGIDRRKLTKLCTGPGDLAQWTANGAASNWQCVDDNPPDGDTTYVSSNGSNYDSYGMGTSGLGTAPSMVVAKSYVRKDDVSTRSIQIGVRSSGQNGLGTAFVVGSSYAFTDACISTDPATGLPPTAAAADAFQHVKYESA